MKNSWFILLVIIFTGCNLSDKSIRLPGGNTYVDEGKCNKFILVNIEHAGNIESCVSEYKFDDNFITASQIDENACRDNLPVRNKRFYIIDIKKSVLYGPLSKEDFFKKNDELKVDRELLLSN